jgi:pimeloyl-ACP methyl ester carboxylesterase
MRKKAIYGFLAILITVITVPTALLDEKTKLEMAINAERAIAGLEEKEIQVGDHKVRYLDTQATAKETILMIHGFGANKDNWIRIAKYFNDNYRIIALDLPGFGESSIRPNANYDAPEQAKRVKAFIDQLGLSKVHITGNSMGGYIAATFASMYPDSTITTWLLNPLGVERAKHSEMFTKALNGEHPYVLPRNEQEFNLLISKVFHNPPYSPDFAITALTEDFLEHYESNERIAYQIHQFKEDEVLFSRPIEKSLLEYPNPLLVIWGDQDKILSPDGLRVMKEDLPNTHAVMMKNMGHAPMIEAPEATANLIKEFLANN